MALHAPSIHGLCVSGLLVVCLSSLAGCHSDRIKTWPVTGRVQFEDGSAVKIGVIELESIDHKTTATGRIGEDGSFVLGTYESEDGAVAGKHRVIVLQLIMNDMGVRHTRDHGHPVPSRYATYDTAGLSAVVEEMNSNFLTITLRQR